MSVNTASCGPRPDSQTRSTYPMIHDFIIDDIFVVIHFMSIKWSRWTKLLSSWVYFPQVRYMRSWDCLFDNYSQSALQVMFLNLQLKLIDFVETRDTSRRPYSEWGKLPIQKEIPVGVHTSLPLHATAPNKSKPFNIILYVYKFTPVKYQLLWYSFHTKTYTLYINARLEEIDHVFTDPLL